MNELAAILAIDCRTSASRSVNDSTAQAGRTPVSDSKVAR
jgi:hypothetical protein